MPRLLFEKTGNAVYISHLDLMRLFQSAFKRAGLLLKHTQGFNPRPSVSIALPMSVGLESRCELLDFDLEGECPEPAQIRDRLNQVLVSGVKVLDVYPEGAKLKHLALLECNVDLEYDNGLSGETLEAVRELFARDSVVVEKKGKNGITQQDIIPMIRSIEVIPIGDQELRLHAVVCCQNPTLNPMQLAAAIELYVPNCKPDFVKCSRVEVYDMNETIFR